MIGGSRGFFRATEVLHYARQGSSETLSGRTYVRQDFLSPRLLMEELALLSSLGLGNPSEAGSSGASTPSS